MSEILSIESIQRAARAAAGRGQGTNPYPEWHPAHDTWQQAFNSRLLELGNAELVAEVV